MAKVRLDEKGRQVKKKKEIFKRKGKVTPHKTKIKAKKRKSGLNMRTEDALRRGGYY